MLPAVTVLLGLILLAILWPQATRVLLVQAVMFGFVIAALGFVAVLCIFTASVLRDMSPDTRDVLGRIALSVVGGAAIGLAMKRACEWGWARMLTAASRFAVRRHQAD